MYKARLDGSIACELFIYINDILITIGNENDLWSAVMQVATRLGYLGLQHAVRKQHELSRAPGAWAGSIIHTEDGVELMIYLECWDKAKLIISTIQD